MDLKSIKHFTIIFLFLVLLGCTNKVLNSERYNGERMILLREAIEIGKKELKKHNALLPKNNLEIVNDNEVSAWEKVDVIQPLILREKIKKLHLQKKKYWMISYLPKEPMLGGIAVVFIDRTNGEIIDFYGGE